MSAEKMYGIKELAEEVGMSECYIRRSIHRGKLQSTLVPLNENSKIEKHMITMEQWKQFRSETKSRSTRDDGRNKYKLYLTAEERERLEALLSENGENEIAELLERANKPNKS